MGNEWDTPQSASHDWDSADITSSEPASASTPKATPNNALATRRAGAAAPRGVVCGHPVPAPNMRHCSRCWRQRLRAAHQKLRDALDVAAHALDDADRQERCDARAALARHHRGPREAAGARCACEQCRRVRDECREAADLRADAEKRLAEAVDKLFDYRVKAWEGLFGEQWAQTEMEFQDESEDRGK